MKLKNDFPYPVLRTDNPIVSGYNKDCSFTIAIEEPVKNESMYSFDISYNLNSYFLNEMLHKNQIVILVTYTTNLVKKSVRFNSDDDISINVESAILQSVDEIKINAMLIANEDLLLDFNNDIDESFNVGQPFSITKNDILAVSNDSSFTFNKSGKTIVKIRKVDDVNFKNGFKVVLTDNDFIIIEVNSNFKKNYDIVLQKDSDSNKIVKTLINSSLVSMAFIQVFTNMCNKGCSTYKNKRWFKVISSSFAERNINFEDKIDEINEDFDIGEISSLVDEFLNHYFDKAVNSCGEVLSQ